MTQSPLRAVAAYCLQVLLQTPGSLLLLCFFVRAGVLPPGFAYSPSVSGLLALASLVWSVMKTVPV